MILFILALISMVGAYLSKAGVHWGWLFLPALASTTVWIVLTRTKTQLSLAAATFDVVVALSYMVVYYAMGERLEKTQYAGIALAIFGCWLIGSGK